MEIYKPDGELLLDAIIAEAAEHEEELMKSDFVKLSWVDEEWQELPIGAYIVPFTDVMGVDGKYARFTLFQSYKPEKTSSGYKYEPEFQHPKMWLRYVPYYFVTQNASGETVHRTEYPFTGQLGTLLSSMCDFINGALGLVQGVTFQIVVYGVDANQTVSVNFSNMDVLSALEEVTKVVECEYHIDWDTKIIWFGKILLGQTPYALVVDQNVGVPTINRSKEICYNCFKVFGSSRNNYRATENGNIAVSDRLTLADNDSVIDLRTGNEPAITTVMIIDDVYPRLELYLYDIHERRKYKKDADGNVTTERWSVWYFRLAYYDTEPAGSIGSFTKDGTVYYWHEFKLFESASAEVSGIGDGLIDTRLPLPDKVDKKTVDGRLQLCVDVKLDGDSSGVTVGVESDGGNSPKARLVPFIGDTDAQDFNTLKARVHVNDSLLVVGGADLKTIPAKYVSSSAIDGLAPSLAFQVNDDSETISPLGTREFEVNYNTMPVTFDEADDVAGQTGLNSGYYEIIHTEEGSDGLIVPTTAEEGIVPMGDGMPSLANNKCFIFNVAIDGLKEKAQAELDGKARERIADERMDTNNYVFPCNPVAFESENPGRHPEIYIGRRVRFQGDGGLDLTTRILKIVTKLDYGFQQTITVGNKMIQSQISVMKKQISDLQSKSGSWENVTVISESGDGIHTVDYPAWEQGMPFYHESYNRAKGWIEQSYVWHRSKKYMCLRTLTTEEPGLGCADWRVVEGYTTFWAEIVPSNGAKFHNGNVDTILILRVWWGSEDVTDIVVSDAGYRAEWTRLTGYDGEAREYRAQGEDLSWTPTVVAPNKILLVRGDMGSGWMRTYRSAMIRCRVTAVCIRGVTAEWTT